MRIIYFKILALCVFFGACASVEEINQPALFWYERIILSIADNDLSKADGYFNALQGEHNASPLIAESLLLLSKAHMENNEHLLAGFFANEYKTRYSNVKNIDYMDFLNIESSYYAFSNYSKNQGFINENIGEISSFVALNPNNKYLPYTRHILTSFKLAQKELNDEVIRIYNLQDKDAAVAKYEQYNKDLGVNDIEFEPSHIPWYVKIFSW